jgi:ABC-type Fe3+-hydroxamate transport system substrate-binding protein
VPSQTELLFHLGLEEEIIGVTKFCVHPKKTQNKKTVVGGTKTLDIELIKSLNPDLIIANKEENEKSAIQELAVYFPVFVTDVFNLDSALSMIKNIGQITHKSKAAEDLIKEIEAKFNSVFSANPVDNHNKSSICIPSKKPIPLRSCYLIWKKPLMTVGSDTFIHSLMEIAGFENIFADQKRYPVISIQDLKDLKCELLLLSTEPYPFKQKHIDDFKTHLPDTEIILVDGEMFSWYGSRLLKSAEYLKNLNSFIHRYNTK